MQASTDRRMERTPDVRYRGSWLFTILYARWGTETPALILTASPPSWWPWSGPPRPWKGRNDP